VSPYWIMTTLVGLAFLGLVAYPAAWSRLAGRSLTRGHGAAAGQIGATEALVDVEAVRGFALLTPGGDLVAMLEVHPFVVTTSISLESVGEMFAQAIRNMPDGETWQITQIPGTQSSSSSQLRGASSRNRLKRTRIVWRAWGMAGQSSWRRCRRRDRSWHPTRSSSGAA